MCRRIALAWCLSVAAGLSLLAGDASAATPDQIALGQQLFTQEFASTPLTENGDGLGPVFNHTSCVACHRNGGVGGAGDHRFNARTLSLAEIRFNQQSGQPLAEVLKAVAPGFVSADGQIVNTAAMHRRGGSAEFDQLRQQTMARFNPHWTDDAAINSDSVRAEASPQQIVDARGSLSMTGQVFARNTTALFGAGLIDMVPDSVIREQFKAQQRHPEIKGRPATLADGRLGKFGWRANFATLLEFTENACVNELGLQSKDAPQPKDMTKPNYVNTRIDISDDDIAAMNAFIATLPAPTRLPATDSQHREEIARGEARFNAIGCAVCHVPTLGPATGLYSDLLLHDMGPYSRDYNAAPPYRKNIDIEYEPVALVQQPVPYYGSASPVTVTEFRRGSGASREFRFEAPQRSPRTVKEPVKIDRNDVVVGKTVEMPGAAGGTIRSGLIYQRISRSNVIQTNFTQEWRTAPLWGLSDSAPYMHDGRAETVLEAIAMHAGESEKTRNRFFALPYEDQQAVLIFLDTLVAPQSGVIPVKKDYIRRDLAVN
ncbi:MAG: di-heme oxidoredictase family protein [Planctomycetaceae bacterium]